MTDDIGKRIRDFLELRGGTKQSWLADQAGVHPSQLSRILKGKVRPRRKTSERLINAIENYKRQGLFAPNCTNLEQSRLGLGRLIAQKLRADLQNSPLEDRGYLLQAKDKYSARLNAVAELARYRHVRTFDYLDGYDRLLDELPILNKCADQDQPSAEIHQSIELVRKFIGRQGPLRVSCGILPGPIATMFALKQDHAIEIDIEIQHASGVEVMRAAAARGASKPYDFFVVATGAFNLTLIGMNNARQYRPVLPVCYEKQENLYWPSPSKRPPSKITRINTYHASSGEEERLVRAGELGNVENRPQDQFISLVKLAPTIDAGEILNVWDPLSVVLHERFGPKTRVATNPYPSLICLYQHERFSRNSLRNVSSAFQRIFVYQWRRLTKNPKGALNYLFESEALRFQFLLGAGLDLKI